MQKIQEIKQKIGKVIKPSPKLREFLESIGEKYPEQGSTLENLIKRPAVKFYDLNNSLNLFEGYSKDVISPTGGSLKLGELTNSQTKLNKYFIDLFRKKLESNDDNISVLKARGYIREEKGELKFYDESKTEHENMLENKIYRIYDCGTVKVVYEK